MCNSYRIDDTLMIRATMIYWYIRREIRPFFRGNQQFIKMAIMDVLQGGAVLISRRVFFSVQQTHTYM